MPNMRSFQLMHPHGVQHLRMGNYTEELNVKLMHPHGVQLGAPGVTILETAVKLMHPHGVQLVRNDE